MTSQAAVATSSGTAVDVLFTEGGRYRDVVGLTDDDMEAIYTVAYHQYQQGQFEEAERAFRILCLHDHLSARFWLGLGATRQMRKDYAGAIMAYSMVAETGQLDPLAPLHAAECYLALGLPEEALSGLEAALEAAPLSDDPEAVIRRIEVLYQALEQMVDALPDDPATT